METNESQLNMNRLQPKMLTATSVEMSETLRRIFNGK